MKTKSGKQKTPFCLGKQENFCLFSCQLLFGSQRIYSQNCPEAFFGLQLFLFMGRKKVEWVSLLMKT
jgi:hypothetical protein